MDSTDLDGFEDIEIGFLEIWEEWKLTSKYFPSKVGGRPAWLALEDLPDIMCAVCNKAMIFLLQVYAPLTEKPECFHRTLFMFVCLEGTCNVLNSATNVKVFRSQLPRENQYYSYEPYREVEENSDKPSAADYVKLCFICGARGPKLCGGCRAVNYCSREHQAMDWKRKHKAVCQDPERRKNLKPNERRSPLFDEYLLDREPEIIELQQEAKTKSEFEVMKEYEGLLRIGQRPNEASVPDDEETSDLIKMAARDTDRSFAKFRTRIMDYPGQVSRYHRGGDPLYVSSENVPMNIPNCEHCGSARQFEFQVMPQMLVHLKVDRPGPSLDWGTLIVYTCKESCNGSTAYVNEGVYKQDYSADIDFLKR